MESNQEPLSHSEIMAIIEATTRNRAGLCATDEEIKRICEWAVEVRYSTALLQMVLAGEVRPSWPEGEPEPLFDLPPAREGEPCTAK